MANGITPGSLKNIPVPDFTPHKRKADSPLQRSTPTDRRRFSTASVPRSPNKKLRPSHLDYVQWHLDLIGEGKDPKEAEAIVTIEMAYDPKVGREEKADFLPLPTGTEGTAGSYYIFGRDGNKIGVFKPRDEEQFMPNNPIASYRQSYDPDRTDRPGNRKGHEPGVGWKKEIAAWRIGGDFADVPFTCELNVTFPTQRTQKECIKKQGSFQAFATGKLLANCRRSEIANLPTYEVHKIAIFDLLTGSGDRTLENVIFDHMSNRLIPIDHGYNFLDSLDWMKNEGTKSETKFAWLRLDQIKQPVDPKAKKWALDYDIEANSKILAELGLSEGSIREHKLRVFFVQWGLRQGFDLQYLGKLSSPSSSSKGSILAEVVVDTKVHLGETCPDEQSFFDTFEQMLDHTLL